MAIYDIRLTTKDDEKILSISSNDDGTIQLSIDSIHDIGAYGFATVNIADLITALDALSD